MSEGRSCRGEAEVKGVTQCIPESNFVAASATTAESGEDKQQFDTLADTAAATERRQGDSGTEQEREVSHSGDTPEQGVRWQELYERVVVAGRYNYQGSRVRIPSGFCIEA